MVRNRVESFTNVQIHGVNLLSILVGLVEKVQVKKELLQSGSFATKTELRVRDDGIDNKKSLTLSETRHSNTLATQQSKEVG